jgi:hypothetical protein
MREHCRAVPPSLAIVNGKVWSRPGLSAVAIEAWDQNVWPEGGLGGRF